MNENTDGDSTNVTFNLRFPGQYYDAESSLHYNRFRYYDTEIGRYISADPIGLKGGLNVYEYASSTPTMRRDFFGLSADDCLDCNGKPKQGNDIARRCCHDAPPLPNDAPNPYGPDETYMFINARGMFEYGGNGKWGQIVRGCLVCMLQHGSGMHEAHMFCYFWPGYDRTGLHEYLAGLGTAVFAAGGVGAAQLASAAWTSISK